MHRWRRIGTIAALTALGVAGTRCAAGPDPVPLPFDARPAMRALLADADHVARLLEHGALAEGVPAADRMATLRLGEGIEGVDPQFRLRLDRFRATAAELAEALRADDPIDARRGFDRLLQRCAECHARFREGGAAGAPLRVDLP